MTSFRSRALAAVNITLTAADLQRLDEAAPIGAAAGERYSPEAMKRLSI